eukprot:471837_1
MTTAKHSRMGAIPKYKLVFIGDEAVGKTSIITRYVNGEFDDNYEATIGVDFLTKTTFKNNDSRVKLQLWDTAGQERFRSLIPSYIRNTHCVCLVFDITSKKSFDNIDFWYHKMAEYCANTSKIQVVLVANKADLHSQRQVSFEQAKEKAEQLKINYILEMSAKSGFNVEELFHRIVDRLPQINKIAPKLNVQLDDPIDMDKPEESGCGC